MNANKHGFLLNVSNRFHFNRFSSDDLRMHTDSVETTAAATQANSTHPIRGLMLDGPQHSLARFHERISLHRAAM